MGKHDLLFSFSSSYLPIFSTCMQFLATQKKPKHCLYQKWADSCYALDACACGERRPSYSPGHFVE